MRQFWSTISSERAKVMSRWLLLALICVLPFELGADECGFRIDPPSATIDSRETCRLTLKGYEVLSRVATTLSCNPADLATKSQSGESIDITPNPSYKKTNVKGKCTLYASEILASGTTLNASAEITIARTRLHAQILLGGIPSNIQRPLKLTAGDTITLYINGGKPDYTIEAFPSAILTATAVSYSSFTELYTAGVTASAPGAGTITIKDGLVSDPDTSTYSVVVK